MNIDVTIDLHGEAYVPNNYVLDMRTKIDLYRRINRIANDDDLTQLGEELHDRFGQPPKPVLRLLELQALRIDSAVWQIISVRIEDNYLVYTYTDRARAEQLVSMSAGRLRIVDSDSLYQTLPRERMVPDEVIAESRAALRC